MIMRRLRSTPVPGTRDSYTGIDFNLGFHIRRYELDLTYRVAPNLLMGTATLHMDNYRALDALTLDLGGSLRVEKVTAKGTAGTHIQVARFRHAGRKLRITFRNQIPVDQEFSLTIRYRGNPRPLRSEWGMIGWEELDNGALVAAQPNGAPSWFPCDDTPDEKALFDVHFHTDNGYAAIITGDLISKHVSGSMTTWHYQSREPMATYLAAVHVGEYDTVSLGVSESGVVVEAYVPVGDAALRARILEDFAKQVDMLDAYEKLFGPYPFRSYRVVITEDELEIPLEAQGLSSFEPTTPPAKEPGNDSSPTNSPTSGLATHSASPNGTTSGSTKASPVTRNGSGLRQLELSRLRKVRWNSIEAWRRCRRIFCWPTPARRICSTTASTSAAL